MAIKKSIRLSTNAETICKELTRQDDQVNWSGTVNQVFDRYDYLVSNSMPELSAAEKEVYCRIFSNLELSQRVDLEVIAFGHRVSEAIYTDLYLRDLLSARDLDAEAFKSKSEEFSPAQKLAIIDFAQRSE